MKILPLLVILVVLFRETRHQLPLFFPPISVSLANEEFIEPSSSPEKNVPIQDDLRDHLQPPSQGVVPAKIPTQDIKSVSADNDGSVHQPSLTISEDAQQENGPVDILDVNVNKEDIRDAFLHVQDKQDDTTKINTNEPTSGAISSPNTDETKSSLLSINGTNGSEIAPVVSVPALPLADNQKKGEEEEPIPSYMEWAQKKQQELITNLAGQNGHSGNLGTNGASGHQQGSNGQSVQPGNRTNTIDAKNFASPDCGAKVVQSNSEAQNAGGVLSSSHDEYMLNKCGTSIWFVIELCEPLTVERISLGNLELFSSSPKEIEFGISDRYPTREWVKLGPFSLPDARAIHPVVLPPTNTSTFGKFIKVSILSHYGTEHYCPVSVIRVNGKSEYEVLESETTHQEDRNKESALFEEPLEDGPPIPENVKSVGGLKDAVFNILNRAVQTIVNRGSTLDSLAKGETELSLKSKCRSVLQCVPRSSMEQDIYKLLSCNASDFLPFLASNAPWCGWDYCHAIFGRQSIGLPWQPEGFFASLFGGQSVLHALCHFNKPLTEGCDPTSLSVNTTVKHSDSSVDVYINESLTAENVSLDEILPIKEHIGQIPPPVSPQQVEEQNIISHSNGISGTTESPPEQQGDTPPAPPTPPPTSGSGSTHQETQIPPPSPTLVDESILPSYQHQQGGGTQQKESVFVRLTNRIKNLERNQSLTASYLEELSRRFKKQNEDNSVLSESSKRISNETRVKLLQLDEYYRQELQSLRRNMDDVRERLFTVQLQRSLLVFVCLSQSILVIGVCIWAKRKVTYVQSQLDSISSPGGIPLKEKHPESTLQQVGPLDSKDILIRKRSNSDSIPDKIKKIKKRSKKQNVADVKFITGVDRFPHPSECRSADPFNLPKSQSGEGFFSVPPYSFDTSLVPCTPKENIDPQFRLRNIPPCSLSMRNPRIVAQQEAKVVNGTLDSIVPSLPKNFQEQRPNSLLTKVDPPVTIHSSIPPLLDSSVSTSGRFALLASPGPDSPTQFPGSGSSAKDSSVSAIYSKPRSGSTESSISTSSTKSASTSHSSLKQGGLRNILNGHYTHSSATEPSSDSKKGKKGGLKALMPKLFDR